MTLNELGEEVYYVWEVKPHSYELENRLKGIEQINGYVNDGYIQNSNAQILCGETGFTHIASGFFDIPIQTQVKGNTVEDIHYTVRYHNLEPAPEGADPIYGWDTYPNQAGIIIYDFTRYAHKYKKNRNANEDANSNSNSDSNSDADSNSNSNTDTDSDTNSDTNENQDSQEDNDDYIETGDGFNVFNGGAGNDTLCGGNGEDTYVFAKGYAQDTINERGADNSMILLTDISSDEVTISDQYGSNLLIAVTETEDVLTISNFKWGQATYVIRFADGAEGYVDKDTWRLVLTKQPDVTAEETSEEETAEEETEAENPEA